MKVVKFKEIESKMKSLWFCLLLAVLVGSLTGCTSTNPASQVTSREIALEVIFDDPKMSDELVRLGLRKDFVAYWQAHKDRNWAARFRMENLTNGVTEKFYVAYYDKAWPLKRLSVRGVSDAPQAATVNISYTFTNPETSEEVTYSTPDGWVLVAGIWKHVVSDPMLSGVK
ncbi:MAG: hypothetical protein CFE44_24765 [Burkholderiales bacterium PBB4]|nr:MAG: hypothetical protein CFE44_24765 [Burkholderiales bacterium PBB4]